GYETSQWFGLGVPTSTPAEIVDKLNKEINAALADPKIKARLADLGGTPHVGSPAGFGQLIAEETEKGAKVGKLAGMKPGGAGQSRPIFHNVPLRESPVSQHPKLRGRTRVRPPSSIPGRPLTG